MCKKDVIQVKSKPKAYNNCVSQGARFEYAIGAMDMESKDATSNARYGLTAINNFTNIAEVVPIRNKTPAAMIDDQKNVHLNGETKTAILR